MSRGVGVDLAWFTESIARGETLVVCPLVVAELYAGALVPERLYWDTVISALGVEPEVLEDGRDAGIRRFDLALRGIQVGVQDAVIAAVARRIGATVVTHNVRDFLHLDVPICTPPAQSGIVPRET
jgi:predicted nucleic acid-binding protein